jgi:hypothetical protein
MNDQMFHFYASSVCTWMVDNDIHSLIARMEEEQHGYNLYFVPVPKDSDYEIKMYAPVVDGLIWLGYKSTDQVRGYITKVFEDDLKDCLIKI